ncbi:MAG TPA: hypothetical protein VFE62_17035 [Gemmataceae bacterium]|nr:hypothetical protein [Gemmataceae bacterium]
MGFRTNRSDVENQVRQGGWAIAFGGELTEFDIAEGAVAAGVSIFTDNPGPVMAWLDQLISESLAQMGNSIAANFAPVARQQAEQFARGVIANLLRGRNVGEQFLDLFHFNLKAGVAQFVGQNTQFIPNASVGGFENFITSGDTGGSEQPVGPNIFSWCPYVGLRFNPSVGAPPPPPPAALQRVQWIGDNQTWYNEHEPGVWHEFLSLTNPQFLMAYRETGRDPNFVFLITQPNGPLEVALGIDRVFNRSPGQGWAPTNITGRWKA